MDFGDKIGLQPLYLLNVFAITFPHDSIFFLFLMFCCEILEKEAVNQVIFEKRAVKPSEKSLQTVLEVHRGLERQELCIVESSENHRVRYVASLVSVMCCVCFRESCFLFPVFQFGRPK